MKRIISILILVITFNGCIIGDVVALPFKVTGAVVNTITPDIVGDSISTTGDVVETVIPF